MLQPASDPRNAIAVQISADGKALEFTSTNGGKLIGRFVFPTAGLTLAAPLTVTGLPAADPHVSGQLYTSAGAVMVSAG